MARRELSFIVASNYDQKVYRRTASLALFRALLGLAGLLAAALVAALVLAGSGAYRIGRLAWLEQRNRELEAEFAKVSALRRRLDRLEQQERRLAEMLGVKLTPPPVDWQAAALESAAVPAWAGSEVWGTRPIPALVPLENYAVSRGFTARHPGIDLAAQSGSAVRAAADGIVNGRGTDSVFGRYVLLGHLQGYETYYGHLKEWKVGQGDTVRLGQTVGTVGSSGRSSAPHLHFEIRKDKQPVDPAGVLVF